MERLGIIISICAGFPSRDFTHAHALLYNRPRTLAQRRLYIPKGRKSEETTASFASMLVTPLNSQIRTDYNYFYIVSAFRARVSSLIRIIIATDYIRPVALTAAK